MREQWGEIDATVTDHLHQSSHALFAARTKRRHDAVISDAGRKCFVWNLELAGIDAKAGKCSRRPQTSQRAFEFLLRAKSLNRHIGTAAGETFYFCHNINVSIVECDVRSHSF